MTDQGMDPRQAGRMRAELVAPVVGALVDPGCTLNGQVIVSAGGGLRVADAVEWGTVLLPGGPTLTPGELSDLVARSRCGPAHTYRRAQDAFQGLTADLADLADPDDPGDPDRPRP